MGLPSYLRLTEHFRFLLGKVYARLKGSPGMLSTRMDYDSYLELQRRKTEDSRRRQIWLGEEWEKKIFEFETFFKATIHVRPPSKALCVGARTGQEVVALRSLGIDAVGIDLVPHEPLVVEGDMHDIPFPTNHFDFLFTNCFDHSLMPQQFVNEAERVVRPGGTIMVLVMLNLADDEFGVTDVFAEEAVPALFRDSRCVESEADTRLSPMNHRYVFVRDV